jgi:hypothetical protein
MIRNLRNLLVALAALATLIAGGRPASAIPSSLETAVSRGDDNSGDDSREDDSGTRSKQAEEQAEEDDNEEQDGRELHLFATSALSCSREAGVPGPPRALSHAAHRVSGRSTHVRGPPASL